MTSTTSTGLEICKLSHAFSSRVCLTDRFISYASTQVGDTIQNPSGTASITVARVRSAIVEREVGDTRDAVTIFEFEDGEEGEVVWTIPETEPVMRRVLGS